MKVKGRSVILVTFRAGEVSASTDITPVMQLLMACL